MHLLQFPHGRRLPRKIRHLTQKPCKLKLQIIAAFTRRQASRRKLENTIVDTVYFGGGHQVFSIPRTWEYSYSIRASLYFAIGQKSLSRRSRNCHLGKAEAWPPPASIASASACNPSTTSNSNLRPHAPPRRRFTAPLRFSAHGIQNLSFDLIVDSRTKRLCLAQLSRRVNRSKSRARLHYMLEVDEGSRLGRS